MAKITGLDIHHMSRKLGQHERLSRFQRWRRLVIFILLVFLTCFLLFVRSSQSEMMHDRIEAYGVALIMLGIGGRLWSILYVGGKKAARLVTTGPYSIMRNPLYLFSSIAAAGVGAQMGSFVATIGFAILCALTFYFVILREEKFLQSTMGQAYNAYMARVPRFFPKFKLYRDEKEVTFRPAILKQTLIDGCVFFISIPVFELIEMAQDKGSLPILFTLP